MSDTIPVPAPDLVVDQAIQAVHRHEARAHLAEQLTGEPFCQAIDGTASISGMPALASQAVP